MAIFDMVGAPIPIDSPGFRDDTNLCKRVKQLESFIELAHDMEDAEESLKALTNSLKADNEQHLLSLFDCLPWIISEGLLSYAVVLYAKAFTEGIGRTRLTEKVADIFGDNRDRHDFIIDLRNKFYAHQEIEANRHQLFFFSNAPSSGKVRLNPGGQTTRILMSRSIDLGIIEYCIAKVKEYLETRIAGLCNTIEKELTDEQLEVLNKIPKEKLMDKQWRESCETRVNPFSKRNS